MTEGASDLKRIAVDMVEASLPMPFVLRVFELARTSEGVDDLVHLWAEAASLRVREEIEADLQEAIEDREAPPPPQSVENAAEVDRLLDERRAWKSQLRDLVESRGGVSQVAQRAGIPQPSLSRLLNSMSEPRPATLLRLAGALGLPVQEVLQVTPRRKMVQKGRRSMLPTVFDPIGTIAGTIKYGHGRKWKAA